MHRNEIFVFYVCKLERMSGSFSFKLYYKYFRNKTGVSNKWNILACWCGIAMWSRPGTFLYRAVRLLKCIQLLVLILKSDWLRKFDCSKSPFFNHSDCLCWSIPETLAHWDPTMVFITIWNSFVYTFSILFCNFKD